DERRLALAELHLGLEALAEEVDLQVEAPALHILVEWVQVGVLDHRLVMSGPAQLLRQPVRELRLAHADVARDREEVSAVHRLADPRRCLVTDLSDSPPNRDRSRTSRPACDGIMHASFVSDRLADGRGEKKRTRNGPRASP